MEIVMVKATSGETVFKQEKGIAPLKIIAMRGTEELAAKIDYYLTLWAKDSAQEEETFLVESECPRFASGDAKGLIKGSVRKRNALCKRARAQKHRKHQTAKFLHHRSISLPVKIHLMPLYTYFPINSITPRKKPCGKSGGCPEPQGS